ncbi:hypothetical protein CAPTEDRAFT_53190, partial [Capitella teleta]
MRLSVVYENERVILDMNAMERVSDVRERVRDAFGIGSDEGPTGGEMQERKILTLTYCGADLDHKWFITDVGIPSGASIRAVLREELKPTVYIYSVFNEEIVPVIQKINFLTMTAGEFRSIASRKTGLPVGVFRLLNHNGKEMFDCHSLDEYELDLGGTVTLEIWDGWTDFLNLAMMGFSSHVMDSLSSDESVSRYQMRVAMYIAAHFGHVDLAVNLLRMGVRADEPVGIHPIRQWCKTAEVHIDAKKTPIHEAAESGQIGVLRSFVHHNVCTVMAKDGNDLNPLNIALRKKQKPCASFLLTKQWSKMNYTKKHSVPLSIYVKMKRWGERGRDKAFMLHGHWKSSVKNPRRLPQSGALVGQGVQLDGFSSSKMASKTAVKAGHRVLQTGSNGSSPSKGSPSTQSIPETVTTVKEIPQKIHTETEAEVPTRRRAIGNKRRNPLQMIHKAKAGDSAMPLPMISVDSSPRPFVPDPKLMHTTLDLFKKYRGMDSRNYAIRCLSVANSFKDKPWLSQVQQAMTIATRGVRRVIEK